MKDVRERISLSSSNSKHATVEQVVGIWDAMRRTSTLASVLRAIGLPTGAAVEHEQEAASPLRLLVVTGGD